MQHQSELRATIAKLERNESEFNQQLLLIESLKQRLSDSDENYLRLEVKM